MDESNGVTVIELPIDEVVYREDLYPRSLTNHHKVQEYADNLERMPPIEVNQHYVLIDGWHRWMAHKKTEKATIRAQITQTQNDIALKILAVRRNKDHGLQLSPEDKEKHAKERYSASTLKERRCLKSILCDDLSVSRYALNKWLDRIDADNAKEQRELFRKLWLACHTQEEIAHAVGVHQTTIGEWEKTFKETTEKASSLKSAADHATDFDIPQKNIWNGHDKTPHGSFPGSTEPRWVDNLLYFYTQPFDIVIDPFAGSGSTIDVCKKRLRRYWVSDRKPLVERAHEIRLWDLTEGLPPLHNWRDVKLVYLDPPYWKQVEGKYSQDATDLANMPLDQFTETLREVITGFGKKLQSGAHIALIIQPTHWYAPEHAYTDHAMDMVKTVALPLARRIACPCDTPRYTEYLRWAMDHREMLSLNREIIVWRIP